MTIDDVKKFVEELDYSRSAPIVLNPKTYDYLVSVGVIDPSDKSIVKSQRIYI